MSWGGGDFVSGGGCVYKGREGKGSGRLGWEIVQTKTRLRAGTAIVRVAYKTGVLMIHELCPMYKQLAGCSC